MEVKDVRIIEQIYKSSMTNKDKPFRNEEQMTAKNKSDGISEAESSFDNDLAKEMARLQGVGEKLDKKA